MWPENVIEKQSLEECLLFTRITVVATLMFLLGSCATVYISPLAAIKGDEPGGGVEAGIGSIPLTNRIGLSGVAGYHYYNFNSGHDNFMKIGTQIRRQNPHSPLWLGGELCFIRDVNIYNESNWNGNPSANGFSVGAIGGYQLSFNTFDMSIFSGVSMVNFGNFKADNIMVEGGQSDLQFRFGVEFDLPFFK